METMPKYTATIQSSGNWKMIGSIPAKATIQSNNENEMETGTHKNTVIDDELDSDSELELEFRMDSDWLTKSMAISVIKHLAQVFSLDAIVEAVERLEESNLGE